MTRPAPQLIDARQVERLWPLSNVKIESRQGGLDDRVVTVLATGEGRFVLKQSADLAGNRRAANVLASLDGTVAWAPRLVRSNDGSGSVVLGASSAVVMEHIRGVPPLATPENCAALGLAIAELNGLAGEYEPCPVSLGAAREELDSRALRLPSEEHRAQCRALIDSMVDLDSLPTSLIHFDTSLGNAVRRDDGSICLIDWDEAGIGARVLDPGQMLISTFVSEALEVNEDGARAFYRAYRSRIRLSSDELDAIFDASLFHALRLMAWGDQARRWRRIQWASENRDRLLSLVIE